MRTWTRGAAVLVAALVLLAVAVASWRAISAEPPPRPVVTPTASRTTAFPSAEPGFDVQLPLTITEVGPGHKVTLRGGGPRQVAFTVTDDSLVVARLDCALCSGLVRVTASGRTQPLIDGAGPAVAERLIDPGPPRRSLVTVDANGSWTLTLTSVRDLAPASGVVQGAGSRVVVLAGPGLGVSVVGGTASAYDPATHAKLASGRDRLAVDLPAVVEVDAPAAWTLTPGR